jgi:hypothetical protein
LRCLQGYREDKGLYLASDSDEQLLIYIPFMQVVKLHSTLFKGPEEDGEICYSLCVLILDLCPIDNSCLLDVCVTFLSSMQ